MLRNLRVLAAGSSPRLAEAMPWKKKPSSGGVMAAAAAALAWKPSRSTGVAAAMSKTFMASLATAAASDDGTGTGGGGSASSTTSSSHPLAHMRKVSFCQWCGGATKHAIPDGDDKVRAICTMCAKVAYQNPKMVVGCVVEHENKILLCQRKIHPSYGLWCFPSGYLELGESALAGAVRETREESGAEVEVTTPFVQLDIPDISQSYTVFRARMTRPHFSPGPESLDCRLYALDEIPWSSLAFSSVVVSLELYIKDLKAGQKRFHYCTINKRPGSGPSDIHAYTLDNYLCL